MFNDFKKEFENIVEEQNIKQIVPVIKIDSEITYKDINNDIISQIKLLEPFGEKNKVPLFIYRNLKIDSIRALSECRHLKLTLKDDNYLINAIRI